VLIQLSKHGLFSFIDELLVYRAITFCFVHSDVWGAVAEWHSSEKCRHVVAVMLDCCNPGQLLSPRDWSGRRMKIYRSVGGWVMSCIIQLFYGCEVPFLLYFIWLHHLQAPCNSCQPNADLNKMCCYPFLFVMLTCFHSLYPLLMRILKDNELLSMVRHDESLSHPVVVEIQLPYRIQCFHCTLL